MQAMNEKIPESSFWIAIQFACVRKVEGGTFMMTYTEAERKPQ